MTNTRHPLSNTELQNESEESLQNRVEQVKKLLPDTELTTAEEIRKEFNALGEKFDKAYTSAIDGTESEYQADKVTDEYRELYQEELLDFFRKYQHQALEVAAEGICMRLFKEKREELDGILKKGFNAESISEGIKFTEAERCLKGMMAGLQEAAAEIRKKKEE